MRPPFVPTPRRVSERLRSARRVSCARHTAKDGPVQARCVYPGWRGYRRDSHTAEDQTEQGRPRMYRHVKNLQFAAKPAKPDAVYAMKLQELIGGQFGELTVTMQYLFQGWSCRMPGKYKDMLLDIGTEEIGHVEMISTM